MKPDYLLFTAKKYVTAFFVLFFFSFGSLFAQTTCLTPTLVSGFEVDGDVTANTLSPVNGDSWFVLPGNPGTGIGVIGTTAATATPAISASQFKSIIQAASGSVGRNRTYVQRMSVPNLTAMGGWLLIDAFGVRDNISTGSAVDSTVFTAGGQKNGDNPTVWNIGTGGVQTKNDIIDVTGHLRRQTSARVTSTSPLDLWMYASITTLGTSGDRYSDIELFRTQPYIDQSTGHFVNTGPAATGGHTAFVFDNTGSVASPGDLLISINYSISSGLSSLRIWCNINNLDGNGNGITWFNAQPNRPYDLTGDFITGTNSNGYGYAEIASLNGASCLVYSILNNTNIPAGAWGNLSGSSANYDANIQSQQLVNVAINLTDFGLDNATVSGPCFNIFGSILIKTRSSSSYSSELKDFIGPLTFANFSEVNSNAGPDMFITCDSPAPTLQGSSLTPGATFSWTTPNGNIVSGASTAHPVVNAPGTYILAVQNPTYSTCISYDTVIVANNLTPPGANAGPDKSLTCTSLTTNLIGSSTTPGVTYSWSAINGGSIVGSTTTATPVVNAAGCYILTVTNPANGCTRRDTACVTLNNSVPVISGSTQINVSCYAGCNGSASFTVTGGQSPFTYNWSNGATSPSATGLCAGTYTVTVTGSNGCSATSTFNITQPSQNLAVSISSTQPVSCLGGSNGAAIVAANGGTAPYTYNWNTGATTASVSGLTAGSYTATVTDANGCTASGATTVTQPATAVTATLVVLQQVGCYGGSNGSLDLSPAGGSPPYTYQWSNGAWSQDVSGLGAGTYTVTVTDGNGCSAVQSAVITQPAAALSATTSMTQSVACFGGNSGTASVAVSGGTVPYSYMWNTGATTQNISSLAAGTYTVTVTDANGCTTVKSVSITQPVAALTTNLTSSQPVSCFGGANGSINLSVSGGTTPYTYAWSNGATTQDISNISASTYTITVTDARGCTATRSVTITQPAAAVAVSITATPNVSCFGGTNGAATATVTGGTAPYLYQWNTGATTQILSGLIAGLYTVTITDANSCATSGQITITQPAAALVNSLSVTQTVACFGGNNGSINNTVSGGTAPYTYNWSNGASTQNISGLSAGTYTVTVTDSKGCTTVKAVTVTQPSGALTGSITSTTNVSCFGGVNGAVDLTVSGGTGPFTYAWSNGATTQDLTGTASGTYTVTITDSRGCTTTKTATIIQPAASLSASIASSVNISCFGGTNGSVTTTISGGTSPYSYNWSNGSTTQNLTGLGSGTYTVTVTDINGCTATVSANLSQPAASLSTSYSVTSNVSCFGGSNGAIDLSVNGGTPAYTYNWSNGAVSEDLTGVASGNYTVTVTDANGCTSVKTVSISQPAASLSGTAVQNPPVSCFGGSDGAANLAVSGGTGPYTYLWSNGSTLQSILNLSSGTYTVTITDANGCTANASVNITQPSAALTSSTTTTSNISCFAGNNGSVDLTVNGGTMPYAFNWSNGAITEDLSGLPAGSYSVIVTDVNGCTTTAAASITQPPGSLGANIAITQQVACYGGGNGAIDLTVSGGTSPYTINWSNGAVTEDLSGLAVGVYTVNISDANGCITSATAAITQPLAPLSSTLNVLSNVNCFAGTDGTLDLSVSGGSVPYTYLWSSGNVTQDLYNVAAGTYTVTVTDVNGCTLQQSATVTQPAAALTSSITSQTNVLCFGGLNGAIDLTISGGTTPYVYNWSNGANSEDISGLSGGTYTVMVTDANGCNTSISATLSEPAAALNTSISSQLMVACYGDASGSATLNTSGGTVPYTYSWSNGAVSATLSNVGSNSYQVTVTDANGCTAVASVTLSQPAAALSTAISVSQNVSCYSGADGSANLTVNGGTQPYTYLWSNGFVSQNLQNVIAGNYTVTVTDANGCTSQQSVVISEPSATVTGNAAVTSNVNCFGGSNGAIDVTINGGTLPYLYQWNNGSSTEDLSGLDAGTYTVTVTDLNGCSVELTSIITEPSAALNGVLTVSQNVLCYSDSTGMLDLTVTGGTTPYTFNWNTGATSEDLSGLVTGTYTVSVTDANGCTTELTTFIDEPRSALSVTATTVLPVLCNGGSDGGIDVSVSGGTPSYSFSWNNGASTED
ncbi:MAG TPA: hypothetical protein VFW78_01500, partial [Bacteroidia bacterium]|nr:hypothetical protein [Bacteroidia bacterium]